MNNKVKLLLLGLVLILFSVSALSIASPEQGKSIAFYLQTINASLLGNQTTTQQTTQITTTGTGTSVIANQQTLTAECIERVLVQYDSPVKNMGLGEKIISEAKKYNIEAGYALATFRAESTFGKNGYAVDNKSIGNRRDTSGNFIKYNTWEAGIEDWFSYINRKYISEKITTVETIAPIYAPSSENNTAKYITDITGFMAQHKGMC
ncbi:MAG: hypothetical protein WCW44_05755 [archaeon]|jgi:hypothetical protein